MGIVRAGGGIGGFCGRGGGGGGGRGGGLDQAEEQDLADRHRMAMLRFEGQWKGGGGRVMWGWKIWGVTDGTECQYQQKHGKVTAPDCDQCQLMTSVEQIKAVVLTVSETELPSPQL